MIADKLRQAILQAAIQGKLTKQLKSDGSARDLLAKIQTERGADLSEIVADEIPFDIPDNWCWVHLGDIGTTNIGLTYKPSNIKAKGTCVLRSGNIQGNKMDYTDNIYVDCIIPESKKCYKGDLLICARNGSKRLVGKAAIVDKDGMAFGAFMACFRSKFNPYIHKYVSSPFFRADIDGVNTTTINQITQENLKNRLIPLPPLAEQNRIVARIEALLPELDKLAKEETQLETMQQAFPKAMKDSLLQAAIQGKLTKQLKSDGNARDLLAKIQTNKDLPDITEDDIAFDIPENWCWVRLGKVATVKGGKRIPVGHALTTTDTGYRYIRVADMHNGTVNDNDVHYVTNDVFPLIKNYTISSADVYITCAGTIGRIGTVPDNFNNANLTENADKLVFKCLNKFWLYYTLTSSLVQKQIRDSTTQVGQPKLAIKRIETLLIPLPPLAEQERIVKRLEQLLPLCEELH